MIPNRLPSIKKSLPLLSLALILTLVLSFGLGLDTPGRAAETETAPIEPYLYVVLEREGSAEALVVLREQADLSGVARLETKAEKGQYVYERLVEVAERTQPSLAAFLEKESAVYRSYWIQNMFLVQVDVPLLLELARRPAFPHGLYLIEGACPRVADPHEEGVVRPSEVRGEEDVL